MLRKHLYVPGTKLPYLTLILSGGPHNHPIRQIVLLSPFYKWMKWGTEWLSNLPKVTQPTSGRIGLWPSAHRTPDLCQKGFRAGHPRTWHFVLLIIWSGRLLRNCTCRKGSLTPPSFYLKAGHNISHEKCALLVPGREKHSYRQSLGVCAKVDLYKQTC